MNTASNTLVACRASQAQSPAASVAVKRSRGRKKQSKDLDSAGLQGLGWLTLSRPWLVVLAWKLMMRALAFNFSIAGESGALGNLSRVEVHVVVSRISA